MRIVGAVLGLCGALVCMAFLQTLSTFRATVRASKRLHNAMVVAVFRAKIEFFDTNPSGRQDSLHATSNLSFVLVNPSHLLSISIK